MKQNILNICILIVAGSLLFLCFSAGFHKGKRKQMAKVILANSESLKTGLEYFYNDFERYPKAIEFTSPLDLKPYFSVFPPKNLLGGTCQKTWIYERPQIDVYNLSVCLPEDYGEYLAGWQKITSD